MTLDERFRNFLESLPGAESLDAAGVFPSRYSGERADFAFFERSVIVEVKWLQRDRSARVGQIVDEYRRRPGFPLFYGVRPLGEVLAAMPSEMREEVHGRVAKLITTTLERAVAKAVSQIRETKDVLKVPNAGGVLYLLNEHIEILSPDFIVWKLQELLTTLTPMGGWEFDGLDWVCAIDVAHELPSADGGWAFPFLEVAGPSSASSSRTADFLRHVRYHWAFVEGGRAGTGGRVDAEKLQSYRLSEQRKESVGPTSAIPDEALQPSLDRIVLSFGFGVYKNEGGGILVRFVFLDRHIELLCIPRELCERILEEFETQTFYTDPRPTIKRSQAGEVSKHGFGDPISAFEQHRPHIDASVFDIGLSNENYVIAGNANLFGNAVVYRFLLAGGHQRVVAFSIPIWFMLRDELVQVAKVDFGRGSA